MTFPKLLREWVFSPWRAIVIPKSQRCHLHRLHREWCPSECCIKATLPLLSLMFFSSIKIRVIYELQIILFPGKTSFSSVLIPSLTKWSGDKPSSFNTHRVLITVCLGTFKTNPVIYTVSLFISTATKARTLKSSHLARPSFPHCSPQIPLLFPTPQVSPRCPLQIRGFQQQDLL